MLSIRCNRSTAKHKTHYKCINKYHKGICLLEFKNGIPDIIRNMKVYHNDFNNDYANIVLLNRGVTND